MFAIVKLNGNQYKLIPGKEEKIDLLDLENKDEKELTFTEVLLISDGKKATVGDPTIKGATVSAEILGEGRDKKVRIFKFAAKKRYKRTGGHKQKHTLIKVLEIKNEK
jgi:large subunit ribosomal protein L21